MSKKRLESVLMEPTEDRIWALLHDEAHVFWVNWRASDDTIVNACEAILKTGTLSGKLVQTEDGAGYRVLIHFEGRSVEVPLRYSLQDRHITLCTLNRILAPQYEIRLCLDSVKNSALAFMPLPAEQWHDYETRFPDVLRNIFYVLTDEPNVFTDPFPPPVTWQQLAGDPSQRLAAMKLYQKQHEVGMSEAKQAVDAYIASAASKE